MKALVIEAPGKASVKETPYPKPAPGTVTVRVERVGICGTDIHIYKGEFLSPYPIIPGHEFAGTVHEVGDGVQGFSVGDRVCADPSLFCGECRFCLTHRGNHCLRWGAIGVTVNGAMAEYVNVPAKNLVKLPDHLSFGEGAFVEPVACVVHALHRLNLQAGSSVLLFGAGAMGQQLVQALAKSGASELVVVDVSERKLEMAKAWGATECVLAREIGEKLDKSRYPYGFDVVVDATGLPGVIEKAFQYMGPAAKYLQFGVTAESDIVRFSPFQLYHKDWTFIGSMAINHEFIPAFDWVRTKRIEVAHLISKTITLEEAVDFLAGPRDPELLKVQIRP